MSLEKKYTKYSKLIELCRIGWNIVLRCNLSYNLLYSVYLCALTPFHRVYQLFPFNNNILLFAFFFSYRKQILSLSLRSLLHYLLFRLVVCMCCHSLCLFGEKQIFFSIRYTCNVLTEFGRSWFVALFSLSHNTNANLMLRSRVRRNTVHFFVKNYKWWHWKFNLYMHLCLLSFVVDFFFVRFGASIVLCIQFFCSASRIRWCFLTTVLVLSLTAGKACILDKSIRGKDDVVF